jgi:deferrochelatase/peroxidase EfeB
MVDVNNLLDLDDPSSADFLKDIQGNILRAHAREHAAHILIRFRPGASTARDWVAKFGKSEVTSAAAQAAQSRAFQQTGDGGTFANFALSATGYAALGVSLAPVGTAFAPGMKNSAVLQPTDPPPSTWEAAYQGELHALAVLADQNVDRLQTVVDRVAKSLAPIADLVHVERGDRIKRVDPRAGELTLVHFGFADGVSQPLTIRQDAEKEVERRGMTHWDPGAPLRLLLASDPAGGWGSYFVFRKLEQNVAAFYKAEAELVQKLGLAKDPRRAEALIVGRYRDGYPAISTQPEPDASPGNDFNFDDDRFGAVCPYQAHIRKTNPRGDLASAAAMRPPISRDVERGFRIARRGISYGSADYLTKGAPPPKDGVGLLFMSVQGSLANFEIQQAGSDSNDFANVGIGVDATIGHAANPIPQTWIAPSDIDPNAAPVQFTIANFVTLRGGEYFFLPSMGFFQKLGGA